MPNKNLGGRPADDLTGRVFSHLTVLKQHKKEGLNYWRPHWICKCDCGKTRIASARNLIRGHVKSCGCMANIRLSLATDEQIRTEFFRRFT